MRQPDAVPKICYLVILLYLHMFVNDCHTPVIPDALMTGSTLLSTSLDRGKSETCPLNTPTNPDLKFTFCYGTYG